MRNASQGRHLPPLPFAVTLPAADVGEPHLPWRSLSARGSGGVACTKGMGIEGLDVLEASTAFERARLWAEFLHLSAYFLLSPRPAAASCGAVNG